MDKLFYEYEMIACNKVWGFVDKFFYKYEMISCNKVGVYIFFLFNIPNFY